MSNLGSAERPLRVAIIGSGPSGFYAADALLKSDISCTIDMFDRLPTPFGLVRGGVAPDHPKIKNVTCVYDKIAAKQNFSFLGNVKVGRDLSVEELRIHYDAVIFACGAETDRLLGIPGEDLPGSHTATEFVGWYNGHPDYHARAFDLSQEVAVIIGQGNVAIDVTRILSKTADELNQTDIAQHALQTLAESRVREIHLIGRRGPVQAKFTNNEIKELGQLPNCNPTVDPKDLKLDPLSQAELDNAKSRLNRNNFAILQEFVTRDVPSKLKRCHIHFFKSPIEIQGNGRIERIILERNELIGDPGQLQAKGTGVNEQLPCSLVFRSVGYRGIPIPGVPFDERHGVFPNEKGRIGPGLYAVGWIKRGPSGVIGTNKPDSAETVKTLLADLPVLAPCTTPDSKALKELLQGCGVRTVSFNDWHRINSVEIANGQAKNKPREKFTQIDEMLAILDKPVSNEPHVK